jgi:hypothetical protein
MNALTVSMINREALALFLVKRGEILGNPTEKWILEQYRVDVQVSEEDLALSLYEFSARFISPCMTALAKHIPRHARFESKLMLCPEGYLAAADRLNEVALRTMIAPYTAPIYADYAWDNWSEGEEEPEPIGYRETLIMRFDLRCEV